VSTVLTQLAGQSQRHLDYKNKAVKLEFFIAEHSIVTVAARMQFSN